MTSPSKDATCTAVDQHNDKKQKVAHKKQLFEATTEKLSALQNNMQKEKEEERKKDMDVDNYGEKMSVVPEFAETDSNGNLYKEVVVH